MVCKICGEKSGFYPLCRNCNILKDDGAITKCDKCGIWKKDSKPLCHDCWSNENKSVKHVSSNRGLNETECEVCGNNSYGKPFCLDCYEKSQEGLVRAIEYALSTECLNESKCEACGNSSYRKPLCGDCYNKYMEGLLTKCENCGSWKDDDKPLCHDCWAGSKNIIKDVKAPSTNDKQQIEYICQNFRERYKESAKIRTKQGIYVRSKIEREIADFFADNDIIVHYEPILPLDGVELHPDFYIQAIGRYLEHWGRDEPSYVENRRKKEELYKKHNVKYISTEKSDEATIHDKLKLELSKCGIHKTDWK
jgi:hypothetical protein